MRQFYVYILASKSRVLYVGVTNNIHRRVAEHRQAHFGFTARYHVHRLVYVELTTDVRAAINREKQLKRWPRSRKRALIERDNPGWKDLAVDWF